MPDRPVIASLQHADEHRLTVRVDLGDEVRLLDYVGQGPTWERPPPTHDFVAVALTHLAAASGRDLLVDGPVSVSQLDRLAEHTEIWSSWLPDVFAPVQIRASEEVEHVETGCRRGAVLAFSGGVDDSFALAAHHDGLLGRLSRDISTGVLVVGWDLRHGDDQALSAAHENAAGSLCAYDAGTRVVATNWQQDFCPNWPLDYGVGLAALLHTFGGSHDAMVVGSPHAYADEFVVGPTGLHSTTTHLLGADHLPLVSTGGTHRRIDRLRHLLGHPVLLARLRFCHRPGAAGANCGRCEKCVRTQLEMRACGIDPRLHVTEPMSAADVAAVQVERASQLVHLEDVAEELPADDEFYPAVQAMLRRERRAWALSTGRTAPAEAEQLSLELAATQAELDAVLASRARRLTEEDRPGRSRLRA